MDSAIFGDPCPGTNKYVEVHYTCKAQKQFSNTRHSGTTNKPLPPWLLALDATPSSALTTTTERTTEVVTSAKNNLFPATSSTPDRKEGEKTVPNPIHKRHKESRPKTKSIETAEKHFQSGTSTDIGGIIVEEHIVKDNPYEINDDDEEDEPEDDSETDDFPEQVNILEQIVDHCPPRTERNLFWNSLCTRLSLLWPRLCQCQLLVPAETPR